MNDLLTLSELSARLRVSDRTVYRMIADGCPHLRIRRAIRFQWDRVLEWNECQFEKTPPAAITLRYASAVNAFTVASRRVQLRVMPSRSRPKSE